MIVALLLCASPLVAIMVNRTLPGWSFLPSEQRNIIFLCLVPLVLGIVSETRPVMIGDPEARDGSIVFAAIILIAWFLMLLKGWGTDFWVNFLPFFFFLSQAGAFHAGRWIGRIPRRKMPQASDEG
ncbi:MAG TPA: hypothetical protein VMU18_05565 [Rhodoblastus sp.]|nr:hypothetical protein [Rhodoblastus sp.]